jgi:hypothetical protein
LRRHDSIDNSAYVKGKAPHSGGALVLKAAMIGEATKAEKELVDPLLQFRNWGSYFRTIGARCPMAPIGDTI